MTLPGLVALLALATPSARAQAAPAPADTSAGSRLEVYLLTFDPGPAVWERFGHNAIWIHDPVAGSDWAYDYGRFSFRNGFFARFAVGDLRYSMGKGDARAIVAAYQRAGRQIWLQELDLTREAKAEMQRYFEWNYLPEHREYDYNYYVDNCSTRLRDAIDRAVGGQLRAFAEGLPTDQTYRDQTRRTTENNLAIYTGLMAALGQPVDHLLNGWEAMFLPIELRPYLDRLTVRGPDGREHPLVREERLLAASERFLVAEQPTPMVPRFLLTGLVAGLLLLALGRSGRGSRAGRRVFTTLAVGWSVVAGVGGLILLCLWAFTTHRFSFANENLLQLNVLSLATAVALPASLRRPAALLGLRLAWIVAALSALGVLLKVLPFFYQANLDLIGLVAPIHLGLLAGLYAARGGRKPTITIRRAA